MFAVVVLRSSPSEHCVVPEKYIHGIDDIEAELKTWGTNKAHDHLVFWSRELLNDDITPSAINHPPNFNLPKHIDYPPRVAACCYLARVKRFFRSFQQAKEYRDRFRPVLPVIYNGARLNKQPAPPNSPQQENLHAMSDAEDDAIFEFNENDSNEQPNHPDGNRIDNDEIETKFVLPTVELNNSDNNALDNLFNAGESVIVQPIASIDNDVNVSSVSAASEHDISTGNSTDNQVSSEVSESNESSGSILGQTSDSKTVYKKLADNRLEITHFLDDDMVMKYIYGEKIRVPVIPAIKANDLLSGNWPFYENVSDFRAPNISKNVNILIFYRMKMTVVIWFRRMMVSKK